MHSCKAPQATEYTGSSQYSQAHFSQQKALVVLYIDVKSAGQPSTGNMHSTCPLIQTLNSRELKTWSFWSVDKLPQGEDSIPHFRWGVWQKRHIKNIVRLPRLCVERACETYMILCSDLGVHVNLSNPGQIWNAKCLWLQACYALLFSTKMSVSLEPLILLVENYPTDRHTEFSVVGCRFD